MAGRHSGLMTGAVAVAVVLMLVETVPVHANFPWNFPWNSPGNHNFFPGGNNGLSSNYYDSTCPGGVLQIYQWIQQLVAQDNSLPAAWVRLQFHDCFVRGCDASIMINNTDPNTEINSRPNKNSIRGLIELNTVKAKIEAYCPGIVSCADLIVLAARDSVQALTGPFFGESWPLQLGRKDGSVSLASESTAGLPAPVMNFSTILPFFTNVGLSIEDLVVLSGAHTIGFTHCSFLFRRLYNFPGSANGVDPSLDPTYAAQLQQQCPNDGNSNSTRLLMDPSIGGQMNLDSNYMRNVLANRGLFTSDATLLTNSQSYSYLQTESVFPTVPFFRDFAVSMQKMSLINVLTGSQGNVRLDCSKFNS